MQPATLAFAGIVPPWGRRKRPPAAHRSTTAMGLGHEGRPVPQLHSVWPLLLSAVIAVATGPAVAAQEPEALLDVSYVADPHPEQHLDFTWPGTGAAATVVFIHGGGLSESGERRDSPRYRRVCEPFVAAGIACATIDYRLAPGFRWPAMPRDAAAAVAKIRTLVAERGGDPDRLFLFGHSSGCHLAAILATDSSHLGSVGLAPGNIAGAVLMGCVLDNYDAALRGVTADEIRDGFRNSRSDVVRFGAPENWLAANPSRFLGPHVPPVLVVVAEAERFAPAILEQGARFVRLLRGHDVAADVVIVPGTHRSSVEGIPDPDDPTWRAIRAFIADTARTPPGGRDRNSGRS